MKTYLIEKSHNLLELLSAADIRRQTEHGKIHAKTRIYQEEDNCWVAFSEHPDWKTPTASKKSLPAQITTNAWNREWYYLVGSQPIGAFNYLEMIQLQQSKRLAANTVVWRQGMMDWAPMNSTKEFHPLTVKKVHQSNLTIIEPFFKRRQFHRVPYCAQFVLHNEKQIWRALSFEIGAGGMGIICDGVDLKVGQELFIHKTSTGTGPQINARVILASRSANGLRPGQVRLGLEFVDISRDSQQDIQAFTQNLIGQS